MPWPLMGILTVRTNMVFVQMNSGLHRSPIKDHNSNSGQAGNFSQSCPSRSLPMYAFKPPSRMMESPDTAPLTPRPVSSEHSNTSPHTKSVGRGGQAVRPINQPVIDHCSTHVAPDPYVINSFKIYLNHYQLSLCGQNTLAKHPWKITVQATRLGSYDLIYRAQMYMQKKLVMMGP